MSGHSKWSKIKRKKGATDAKRGKIFSRIVKEITVAVKEGGNADPDFNPRLRTAIANAKGVNMPKDNIDRAIKKASDPNLGDISQPTFEGYAHGGVAVFIECTTDNNKRTVAHVRAVFNKKNGNMATTGSVDFLFERKSIFEVEKGALDEDEFMLEIIDGGAEDVELDEGVFTITAAFEDFGNIQKKLEELNVEPKSANLERIPLSTTTLDVHGSKLALQLIEALEEVDDVDIVFHNLEMTDELVAALEAE